MSLPQIALSILAADFLELSEQGQLSPYERILP